MTKLSTPTSVPDATRIITELNKLIADYLTLYVKCKSFHWHLFGPRFHDLHLLFDEQATEVLDAVDPLAERVRKLGGSTITGIQHILGLRAIRDEDIVPIPAAAMITRLLVDNQHLAGWQRGLAVICADATDSATENLLAELTDKAERRVWFLFELSQTED